MNEMIQRPYNHRDDAADARSSVPRRVSLHTGDVAVDSTAVTFNEKCIITVIEIQSFDVLCGRRIVNRNDNAGNERFAAVLVLRRNELLSARSITRIKSIVTSVVDSFILHSPCAPGGRFLMPLSKLQNNNENNKYIILSRRAAVNWVCRELRDIILISKNGQDNSPPCSPKPATENPTTKVAAAAVGSGSTVPELQGEEGKITPDSNDDNRKKNNSNNNHHTVDTSPTIDSYHASMTIQMTKIDKSVENILARQNNILLKMAAESKFKMKMSRKIQESQNELQIEREKNAAVTENCNEEKSSLSSQKAIIENNVRNLYRHQKSILAKLKEGGIFTGDGIAQRKIHSSRI